MQVFVCVFDGVRMSAAVMRMRSHVGVLMSVANDQRVINHQRGTRNHNDKRNNVIIGNRLF